MKTLAAILLSCLPLPALADSGPFQTPLEATRGGLTAAMALPGSRAYEGAGFVYVLDGAYYHTDPAQSHDFYTFSIKATFPPGARLAALFHTHIGRKASPDPAAFSREDIAMQASLGVPSYIYVLRNREIRTLSQDGVTVLALKKAL